MHKTDITVRYKNKANSGRCFVFHQLKIPVVADMIPSNLHIMGNPDNGFLACSKEGWYYSLKELLSYKKE